MQIIFEPNIVSCPKCEHTFAHNRINGLALVEAVNAIEAQKRMYAKLALDALERQLDREEFLKTKKVFLDNFNDWGRSIQTILGLGADGID